MNEQQKALYKQFSESERAQVDKIAADLVVKAIHDAGIPDDFLAMAQAAYGAGTDAVHAMRAVRKTLG